MSDPVNPNKMVSAASLMNRLQQDPEYQARVLEAEARRQAKLQRYRAVAAPIVQELRDAGFAVQSVDELRAGGAPYEAAIPVLVRWLNLIPDGDVLDSLVRALSVPWAGLTAARALINLFRSTSESESALKWTIGNALAVIADDQVFSDIVELVREKRNGKSREMLAVALGNMTVSGAVDALLELLDDPEVAGHAVVALGKLKPAKARSSIERFLNHPRPWVRKEAKRALDRLEGDARRNR